MQVHSNSTSQPPHDQVISCWRLGEQVTGGRWYHIYRAAPRTVSAAAPHDFVIKILNPQLDYDETEKAIDRMSRESFATETLLHPNVIRLLDAELDRTPFFLVQPWIEGRSLDRLFSRVPHLPLTRMLWVLRQIAEGVRAGHEKSRAFLGLDPTHVLLSKTGRATLIGWSQSHAFGEKVWLPHHRIQAARYTAPESFGENYLAAPAADVYAMGALIYHALAMTPPFDGPDVESIKNEHLNAIPEDLIVVQPNCPPSLACLVKQMLAKDPAARPSSREVLNALIGVEIEHLSDTTMIAM